MVCKKIFFYSLSILIVVGCGKSAVDNPSPSQPIDSVPDNKPVAITNPFAPSPKVPAEMSISENAVVFPAALVSVDDKENGLNVLIYSDDPPDADKPGYNGNSFYLDMKIDTENIDDLPGQTYTYKRSPTEREDSNTGISLQGGDRILQPVNTTIHFDKNPANQLVVTVSGIFKYFDDTNPDADPAIVNVNARFLPTLTLP